MKAVVIEQANVVTVKEVPFPELLPGEVILKVEAAGICGSDVHIFHGTYPALYPLIPGHEFSGTIQQIGAGVTGWQLGQRVTADPNIYCGACYYCHRDQENMCENAQASGVTRHGGFAEYVAVPAKQLYALPDAMSFEEGALVEPVACVVYAMQRLQPRYGDRAIVFGAGPMGLLLVQALKTGGACEVAVVDLVAERRQAAQALGASVYASLAEVQAAYPRGLDLVIDATGQAQVIESMFQVAAKRAKLLQFGCCDSDASIRFRPFALYDNDWEYIGTRALLLTFGQAIDLITQGAVTGREVINDRITLEQVPDYLGGKRPAASLKVMVKPHSRKETMR